LNCAKVMKLDYWPDFNVFYYSAQDALHNNNPYLLKGQFKGGYLYPPISLLLFYPFADFPVALAGKLWSALSILCLLASLWLLLRIYNASGNVITFGIAGILAFNYFPVKFTLGMGQLNL